MAKKSNSRTERKIKQAAKEIFLQKGYNGSRTREITEKAGANLALLNYYFGGKEQLFKIVVSEVLEDFKSSIRNIVNNPKTNFEEKISELLDNYLNTFIENPKLLPFIMNEIKKEMDTNQNKIKDPHHIITKTIFSQQYTKKTGKTTNEFKEFFINFLGLVAFPIIGAPIFTNFLEFPEPQYLEFLKKRKEMILKIIPSIL